MCHFFLFRLMQKGRINTCVIYPRDNNCPARVVKESDNGAEAVVVCGIKAAPKVVQEMAEKIIS